MTNKLDTRSKEDSIKESRNNQTLERSVTPRNRNDNKQELSLETKDGESQMLLSKLSDPKPSYRTYSKPSDRLRSYRKLSVRKSSNRKRSLPESSFPEPSLIRKL